MVGLFDKIKILLGIKVSTQDKVEPSVKVDSSLRVEPSVNQLAESQDNTLANNIVNYGVLPDLPDPQKQTEEVSVQSSEQQARELERLKYYAELIKQNKLDDSVLNEDEE